MFGLWLGTAVNVGSSLLTAVIRYTTTRHVASRIDLQHARTRLPDWLARLPVGHPLFQLCVRQFPMGATIVDLSSAATGVSRARHHAFAIIGSLPGGALFAAVGAGLISV